MEKIKVLIIEQKTSLMDPQAKSKINSNDIVLIRLKTGYKIEKDNLGITSNLTENENLFKSIDLLNFNNINRFSILKMLFVQLNMTNEDIYIAYITKNCLNKFRQDFGYKDGTYIKDWNGKEDNVVAFELASNIGATENLFKELYNDLKKIYVCNVAFQKDKKTILDDIDYLIAIDATEI